MTSSEANTTVTAALPVVKGDDHGERRVTLSTGTWYLFGEPDNEVRYGQGFGYRIPHFVPSEAVKAKFYFFYNYNVEGLTMDWNKFEPVFSDLPEEENDLSFLSTFGWKEQAKLGEQGIGIIHKGHTRYMVTSKDVAQAVVASLW